jgi:membrane protease YdiL (CAAX protease family)
VPGWKQKIRNNRLLPFVEFAFIAAVFIADEYHLIWFSKTPYLLAIGWISMAARGIRWRDVGLQKDRRWPALIFYGSVAGLAMEALELLVTQPLLVKITGKYPDLSDFAELTGNIKLLFILIALAWVVAAVGEELVWRGYVMNRVADVMGRSRVRWMLNLLAVSIVFGFAHVYQGVTGVVENVIAALLLGGLYLATGRNLIAPIVAHGVTDTLDFLIIYSGHYPGMHR